MSVQLAFGSAEVDGPKVEDLEGLLCGPGEAVRMGSTARISTVVHEPWRADALLELFAAVGLAGDTEDAEGGGTSVRTPFSAPLAALVARWTTGAVLLPPGDLQLDGGRLRAWLLGSGEPVPGRADAWQLGLSDNADAWPRIGSALSAAGVPGVFVSHRRRDPASGPGGRRRRGETGGAAYRVVGARRLRRLRELVGPAPSGAPLMAWPTVTR